MERIMVNELNNHLNKKILVKGWVYRIRKLKSVSFIILRDRTGLVQCVISNNIVNISEIKLEAIISIEGNVNESNNKYRKFEISVDKLNIINNALKELPIEINKDDLEVNLDTILNNRMISLRHTKINSIFKIQNIIVEAFREFLKKEGFTEIFTPKLVKEGAEGGTELFKVQYFERQAYLAQSPQFYKQMMVGAGFERVYEVGHVYRAEEHNTSRHLNEYISLDLEIGFIEDEEEIMNLEEALLKFLLNKVLKEGEEYIKLLNADIPKIETKIPRIKLKEALDILEKEYNKKGLDEDIDPEGERLICRYVKEKYNCDFIFLTHYPRNKRPMYTMPCGDDETHSFDLLFRGIEITTGGQRIHEYDKLIENIRYKGLEPDNYESYTSNFKYGMPPHGGLAIGLERITAKLLGFENIREASLIPRDRTRLIP